jgi:hypothetical protein
MRVEDPPQFRQHRLVLRLPGCGRIRDEPPRNASQSIRCSWAKSTVASGSPVASGAAATLPNVGYAARSSSPALRIAAFGSTASTEFPFLEKEPRQNSSARADVRDRRFRCKPAVVAQQIENPGRICRPVADGIRHAIREPLLRIRSGCPHGNCRRKRTSFWVITGSSLIPYFIIASRSTPMPNAKPESLSAS